MQLRSHKTYLETQKVLHLLQIACSERNQLTVVPQHHYLALSLLNRVKEIQAHYLVRNRLKEEVFLELKLLHLEEVIFLELNHQIKEVVYLDKKLHLLVVVFLEQNLQKVVDYLEQNLQQGADCSEQSLQKADHFLVELKICLATPALTFLLPRTKMETKKMKTLMQDS
jgi:hypothetical protein